MEKKIEDKIATDASKTSPSNARQIFVLVKSAGIGLLFGFALEKAKIYDPQIIRDQMVMKRFIMLKMFFSALASSTLMILVFRSRFPTAYAKVLESGSDALKKKSVKSVIVGGLILGLGMTIGGSCPGMVFVQLGAGVSNSLVALLGGLVGAYIHGLLNNVLNFSLGKPNASLGATLYEIFDKKPSVLHLGMAGFLLGSSALIELVFPYKADFNITGSPTEYGLSAKIWPPIFAGVLLGSTQLISLLLLNQSLGNSTTFSVCASQLYTRAQLEASSYMKKFSTGHWDRIAMPIGVISGSLLSAYLGGTYGRTTGLPWLNAFAGGFLLVFGARLAGGCNTGHGISGTAHLLLGSAIATASMFAGGMGLAYFLN